MAVVLSAHSLLFQVIGLSISAHSPRSILGQFTLSLFFVSIRGFELWVWQIAISSFATTLHLFIVGKNWKLPCSASWFFFFSSFFIHFLEQVPNGWPVECEAWFIKQQQQQHTLGLASFGDFKRSILDLLLNETWECVLVCVFVRQGWEIECNFP